MQLHEDIEPFLITIRLFHSIEAKTVAQQWGKSGLCAEASGGDRRLGRLGRLNAEAIQNGSPFHALQSFSLRRPV